MRVLLSAFARGKRWGYGHRLSVATTPLAPWRGDVVVNGYIVVVSKRGEINCDSQFTRIGHFRQKTEEEWRQNSWDGHTPTTLSHLL